MPSLILLLTLLAAGPLPDLGASQPLSGEQPAAAESSSDSVLPERYLRWLAEIEPLITGRERALFLGLERDYQREAFIQEFWKVRDPYPRTGRNELKERWPIRVAEARDRYESLEDDRARVYLVHGQPDGWFEVRCGQKLAPFEAWGYQGSETIDFPFALIFYRPVPTGPFRAWRPSRTGPLFDELAARTRGCLHGTQMTSLITQVRRDPDGYEIRIERVLAKPRPRSSEWVEAFVAHSTDLPADSEPLSAQLEIASLGRHQTRTVVHGIVQIPRSEVALIDLAGYRSHQLVLTGEVLADGALFERFRYRFGIAEKDAGEGLALAFERFLRPGEYTLILLVEDLGSARAWRTERTLSVALTEELWTPAPDQDPVTARLFEEATEALAAGQTSLRIVDPHGGLLTGPMRFDTLVSGEGVDRVAFYLDEQPVLTRTRPPFSVEIDLGSYPDLHLLEAKGLDREGREIASDELLVNGGGHRFEVRIVEPRRGERHGSSLRIRAEVLLPEERTLDRLELFLDDHLVATLYQDPFVHTLSLPETDRLTTLRAVAYLPDGHSTEDTAFLNAPGFLEDVDVQFVELYTSVLDRHDRPVLGLDREGFTVLEDGEEQEVVRFERVENLPVHVGVVIDNSASMIGSLDEVRDAALRFFESTIRPRDRAAVITFNTFPRLAVGLTNDRAELGRALAGLVPEGRTALHDSLMFALYYFTGVKGQRALLVLSDGRDEASRFSFEQTLDYARRAGITIYTLGLRISHPESRRHLDLFAEQTGGRSFHLLDLEELDTVYQAIQEELRSQYLLAYQSSNQEDDKRFRTIEVRHRDGYTVKTLSGYYP